MRNTRERLDWIDAAKGLGILLVVVGHVWTRGPVRDAIYAFHMPLFFLLAGFVAQPRPMGDFLRRQWSVMAIPYLAFLSVLMAADPLIELARGHRPMFPDFGAAMEAMLTGGTALRGPLTIFWFAPCLMAARTLQNLLWRLWPSSRDWRWALAMAASLAFGLWIGAVSDFSPQGLLSVPVALVLLWIGSLWRGAGRLPLLTGVAAVAGALILLLWPPVPLNMKVGDYGHPLWSLPIALVLSFGLCRFAQLAPLPPLCALGRMSLVIMFLHVAIVHYCAPYFGKWVLLCLAVAVPIWIDFLLRRWGWGRRYFLGSPSSS